jgi:hypothetical protein
VVASLADLVKTSRTFRAARLPASRDSVQGDDISDFEVGILDLVTDLQDSTAAFVTLAAEEA